VTSSANGPVRHRGILVSLGGDRGASSGRGRCSLKPPVATGFSVTGRRVKLYNLLSATMEADPTKADNQDDAPGFIGLNALRLKVAANVQRKK